jgi:hypothetical protein
VKGGSTETPKASGGDQSRGYRVDFLEGGAVPSGGCRGGDRQSGARAGLTWGATRTWGAARVLIRRRMVDMWRALLSAGGVPRAVCFEDSGGFVKVVRAGPPRESQVGGSVRECSADEAVSPKKARLSGHRASCALLGENRRLEIRGILGASEEAAEEPNAEPLGEIETGGLSCLHASREVGHLKELASTSSGRRACSAERARMQCRSIVKSFRVIRKASLYLALSFQFCQDSGQALLLCFLRVKVWHSGAPSSLIREAHSGELVAWRKALLEPLLLQPRNGHVLQGVHSSPKELGACVIVLRR